MDKKTLYRLSILFAVLGLLLSIYLTLVHYYPSVPLVCSESGVVNCENVLTSQYAYILGIPVAVLGLVFFIAQLVVILVIKNNDAFIALSGIGLAFVAYFIFSEYEIGNICLYCTATHICTLALFAIAVLQEQNKQ